MSSRRAFLTGTAAAVSGSLMACAPTSEEGPGPEASARPARNHPLDGLARENVTVSDIKVTLLSHEYPEDEQWYLDWIPERYKAWKSDSILVEVFTNQGIVGIGGATQYGGPPEVKRFIEETVKPLLVGQNVFDAPFLTCGVSRRGPLVGWGGVDSAMWDVIG